MRYRKIAQTLRVPLTFLMAFIYLSLMKPTYLSLYLGLPLAILGVLFRLWAAGYINKTGKALTASGPYLLMRHPLYFGSLMIGAGFTMISGNILIAFLFAVYFLLFYLPAMKQEEGELRALFGEHFESYSKEVPFFFPRVQLLSRNPFRKQENESSFDLSLAMRNREYNSILGFISVVLLIYWKILHS